MDLLLPELATVLMADYKKRVMYPLVTNFIDTTINQQIQTIRESGLAKSTLVSHDEVKTSPKKVHVPLPSFKKKGGERVRIKKLEKVDKGGKRGDLGPVDHPPPALTLKPDKVKKRGYEHDHGQDEKHKVRKLDRHGVAKPMRAKKRPMVYSSSENERGSSDDGMKRRRRKARKSGDDLSGQVHESDILDEPPEDKPDPVKVTRKKDGISTGTVTNGVDTEDVDITHIEDIKPGEDTRKKKGVGVKREKTDTPTESGGEVKKLKKVKRGLNRKGTTIMVVHKQRERVALSSSDDDGDVEVVVPGGGMWEDDGESDGSIDFEGAEWSEMDDEDRKYLDLAVQREARRRWKLRMEKVEKRREVEGEILSAFVRRKGGVGKGKPTISLHDFPPTIIFC